MIFIIMGVVMYMLWAKKNGLWPYQWETFDSDDEELDHMVVYVADDGYEDELVVLKKKLAQNEKLLKKMREAKHLDMTKKEHDDFKERTIEALGKKDFRIIQLTKALEEAERRVDVLEKHNVDLRNELHDVKVESGYELRDAPQPHGVESRRQSFKSVPAPKRPSLHSQKRMESFAADDDDENFGFPGHDNKMNNQPSAAKLSTKQKIFRSGNQRAPTVDNHSMLDDVDNQSHRADTVSQLGDSASQRGDNNNYGRSNSTRRRDSHRGSSRHRGDSRPRGASRPRDVKPSHQDNDYGAMLPVIDWTVEDVGRWWRQTCPDGAQKFLASVEECNV